MMGDREFHSFTPLLSALLGGLIGGLVVYLGSLFSDATPVPAGGSVPTVLEKDIAGLNMRIADLKILLLNRMEDLEGRVLTACVERRAIVPFSGPEASSSLDDGTLPQNSEGPNPEHWLPLLDPGIGRILVERGISPFDEGISEVVLPTAKELAEIESEFQESIAVSQQLFAEHQLDVVAYRKQLAPFERQRQAERREVLAQLASALDSDEDGH